MITATSAPPAAPILDWAAIVNQAASFVTTEYASLTRAGAPVTWPVTPYRGAHDKTLDVATGLTYPLKAERARRNPRVALSFSFPVGSGLADPATFVVQGLATVRDADLIATSGRYLQASADRFPAAFAKIPDLVLRHMDWYWTRAWVQVTPMRVLLWPGRDLSVRPAEWRASPGTTAPPSDPAPVGPSSGSWRTGPGPDWRRRAAGAIARLGLPVLTCVDADGWPLPLRVQSAAPTPDGFVVVPPAGVRVADGPVFLTFHSHAEVFDGQENIGLVGCARSAEGRVHITVERALSDWGVPRNQAGKAFGLWRAGRRLRPRLATEALRRGQRPPRFDELGFRRPSPSDSEEVGR